MASKRKERPSTSKSGSQMASESVLITHNVEKRKVVSTLFFDEPTLREFALHGCMSRMLEHCGLAYFISLSAATFEGLTREFLSTMRVDESVTGDLWIDFTLGGQPFYLMYQQLEPIFGLSKQPSSPESWRQAHDHYEFWCHSTGSVGFNPKRSEYNYSWSHPCLRIAHKVIRLAWCGKSELNKVP